MNEVFDSSGFKTQAQIKLSIFVNSAVERFCAVSEKTSLVLVQCCTILK